MATDNGIGQSGWCRGRRNIATRGSVFGGLSCRAGWCCNGYYIGFQRVLRTFNAIPGREEGVEALNEIIMSMEKLRDAVNNTGCVNSKN